VIAIVNITPEGEPVDGWNEYQVRINRNVITHFRHRRSEGLATCLRKAADAVEETFRLRQVALLMTEGGEG